MARRAKGLGFELIAYDPYASAAKASALGVRLVTFDEALGTADFFSLHMPLTQDTKAQRAPHAVQAYSPPCQHRHADLQHKKFEDSPTDELGLMGGYAP